MSEAMIEQRLTDLERAVDELQRRTVTPAASGDWLAQLTGSVTDEAAFLEALDAGRAFRASDRPSGKPGEHP